MLEPRLAQVHVHVNKTGRDDQSGCIELLSASGVQAFPDSRNLSVFNGDVAHRIQPAGRIDHAPVLDNQSQFFKTLSSTAIRTAIPFSTWFRITERCESATSDEISRPRLIGPGCITIASGLASPMCSRRRP